MAIRQLTEQTHKFLEITDPKKAVGLWSYKVVRETAMTPVGNTKLALGRFLPQDVARWKRREEMATAMEAGKGKGKRLPNGRIQYKSAARIITEYQEKAKQDTKRLKITDWQMKYRWLHLWERYACRLAAPSSVAGEKDTQMFFGLASAGVGCHEGTLHGGRVFFLRKKVGEDLNADRLRDTQKEAFSNVATTGRNTDPTPQSKNALSASNEKDGNWAKRSCGVATEGSVVAAQVSPNSAFAEGDCVQKSQYRYFVAVVLKPGGTKWWWSLERVNVTWTTNTYDRLIIDPRGKLEWSPMDAEVLTEQVVEKNVCLFMLEGDALFKAITDNDLNPAEKYAHLCYDFDFFCRDAEGATPSFYMRWSAFFNPKRSKFALASKQNPRIIEVMGERKKGWITRQIEVKDRDWGLEIGDSGNEVTPRKIVRHGNKSITALSKEDVAKVRTSDAKLGLGDTPLDKYVQDVAQWVAANNGCAVLPVGASRELRLALSHALFFVTFPDRKPDEVGGILRGYQLPGRLVEHVTGKLRGDNLKAIKERVQKQSEEATARRRKMIVDCLFTRACTAVLLRNNGSVLERRSQGGFGTQSPSANAELGETCAATTPPPDGVGYAATTFRPASSPNPDAQNAGKAFSDCGVGATDDENSNRAVVATSENASSCVSRSDLRSKGVQKVTEQTIVPLMESIGARQIIEKAAWQRGFMEGNPLNQFKAGPTAGIGKLPDLSLALAFESRLGLNGETANATDLLVQTTPIRSLKESQGAIRESIAGVYQCRSSWTPSPGKDKGFVAYPADAVRILRDEGRYYLMSIPKYGLYKYNRDLVFEPDQPGKKKSKSVPIYAYSFKSVGNVRSRSDSFAVEEVLDVNKVMKLARDGRLILYSIDFGADKWLADIVFSKENKQPCKIVPTIPILAPLDVGKKDALPEGRKSGTDVVTKLAVTSEAAQAFITFTFNPTVARDNKKVEGRSWKSYLDAFPAEAHRTIIRWPDSGTQIANAIRNKRPFSDVATTGRNTDPTPQSENGQLASLEEALQKVIETDGVLLTDKEHLDEAIRAATYVVPRCGNWAKRSRGVATEGSVVAAQVSPNSAYAEGICVQNNPNAYNGYILKDRVFKDTDGRAEWRKEKTEEYVSGLNDKQKKNRAALNAKYEAQRKEQKGKPLCEVLSPDLAREAEIEFTRQIEADTLVDAKTPKTFKLESPIKVTDDFKEAVAREFRRIAYTGTMGWKQKLNRPAHEVAVGIWLSRLAP